MIQPFEHIEPISRDQFTEDTLNLSINESSSPKVILLRGLVGSIKIKHVLTQHVFEQKTDYLDLLKVNDKLNPIARLKKYISDDYSLDEFGRIFIDKKFLFRNNSFFDRLKNEFSNYYYYVNKNSHTTAFAYLYRILETISYAFPLIYASKTDDFHGTYNLLKDYLLGNKDKGELGFFKGFIKVAFKKDPIYESSINIDIIAETEEIQKSLFNSYKKACNDESIFSEDTDDPRMISIKFSEYSSFIINLRNRFFHLFNGGQPNLQSFEVIDADYFFKLVNKQSAYWISLVLLEIFKHSISNSEELSV